MSGKHSWSEPDEGKHPKCKHTRYHLALLSFMEMEVKCFCCRASNFCWTLKQWRHEYCPSNGHAPIEPYFYAPKSTEGMLVVFFPSHKSFRRTWTFLEPPCHFFLVGSGGVLVCVPVSAEYDRIVNGPSNECCVARFRSIDLVLKLDSLLVTQLFRLFPYLGLLVFDFLVVR